MAERNEVEGARLARQVEEIEKLIRSGSPAAGGYPLAAILEMTQARLDAVNGEEAHTGAENKDRKDRDQYAAIAYLVDRESKLNSEEKEQYSRFLEMDCFRRKDLDALAIFYEDGAGYDKLSDAGKEEMTRRVAEGIRKGEFASDQMPEAVKAKSAERLEKYGIDVSARDPKPDHDSLKTSQHVVKSASEEADSSKKINIEEKKSEGGVEKAAAGEFGNLAATFSDADIGVKPTDLKSSGTGLSRS